MFDLEATATELRKDKLVDRGRLKPGGRREVEGEIAKLETERHLRAHVLVLPHDESPEEAKPLWAKLGLDEKSDLLLISNGVKWDARGWSLTRTQLDAAMADAAPAYKAYLGKGLVQSLVSLAAAVGGGATAAPAPPQPPQPHSEPQQRLPAVAPASSSDRSDRGDRSSSASTLPWLGIGGAALAGLVGFAIYRRNKRAAEARAQLATARANAERTYTELVLASEELPGEAGTQLQLRAGDLKQQLDAIIADAEGNPEKMTDRVVLGRIAQLDGELAALRTTQLQKARG
jgi:hypothetical protein